MHPREMGKAKVMRGIKRLMILGMPDKADRSGVLAVLREYRIRRSDLDIESHSQSNATAQGESVRELGAPREPELKVEQLHSGAEPDAGAPENDHEEPPENEEMYGSRESSPEQSKESDGSEGSEESEEGSESSETSFQTSSSSSSGDQDGNQVLPDDLRIKRWTFTKSPDNPNKLANLERGNPAERFSVDKIYLDELDRERSNRKKKDFTDIKKKLWLQENSFQAKRFSNLPCPSELRQAKISESPLAQKRRQTLSIIKTQIQNRVNQLKKQRESSALLKQHTSLIYKQFKSKNAIQ